MRLTLLGLLFPLLAGAVTLPYTFTTNTPPSQVNANFSTLRDAINAHEALENGHNTSLEDVLDVNPSVGSSYINFNLKELFSARVENLGSDPSCGASSLGRLIWNTADGLLKVCNGSSYVSIAGTGVNTLASVLTAGNEASTDIDLDGNALVNAKIESLASDPSPGNTGRIFYHTGDGALKLDTGSSIQTIGGAQNLGSVLSTGNVASDDIDFDGNQALNLYGEKLSSDPGGSGAGRIYYNTVDNIFKFHNGSSWLEVGNTNSLSDVLALGNSAGSSGINLNGNQLTNVVIHNNSGDPSVGTEGQFWFDTALDFLRFGASDGNHTVASLDQTQTLTNKTIDGDDNTLQDIPDSALSGNVSLLDEAQTVTGKKTFSTAPLMNKIEATSGGQHAVPDVTSDTFALLGAVQTFSNKSFNSISMLGSLDFNDYAVQDFKLQSLTSNPSQGAGKLYYNSSTGELRFSTGTEWRVLTSNSGGDGIGLGDLSATAPILYDNTTGVFSIPQADDSTDGFMDATDHAALTQVVADVVTAQSAADAAQADATQALSDAAAAQSTADAAITDLTGDVTASGPGSVAATIANSAVTNAKMANMADQTLKGNDSGGAAAPQDLTPSEVTAMLDVAVGDSGSGGTKGLVPAPGPGDATNCLLGDMTYGACGGGGGTWGSITGTLSDQTDLQSALDLKAPLASPSFTGTVTLPTGLTGILKAASGVVSAGTIAGSDLPAPAASAISASDIDWATLLKTGGVYTKTLAANTTFTFSNLAVGTIVVRLTNTASNYTVDWPSVKWAGGVAPTMSTGAKSDIYTFIYDGTDVYGSYVQEGSSGSGGGSGEYEFIGSAYIPATASSLPSVTNSSFATPTDSDTPGPTVEINPGTGTIQTTDADGPIFTVNGLAAGKYRARITGTTAGSAVCGWAIYDGTTRSGHIAQRRDNASTTGLNPITVTGFFTLSAGNTTFQLQADGDGSNTCILTNDSSGFHPEARILFELEKVSD